MRLRRLRGWPQPRFPEAANHPTDNRSGKYFKYGPADNEVRYRRMLKFCHVSPEKAHQGDM
jgi:hypothetical protein